MMIARLGSAVPLADAAIGARFLWALPRFLRCPINAEDARAALRCRLDRREAAFLALACRAVYGHAASPYRRLLSVAGCEYGDLEGLVGREGVEGALRTLFREGVYLTVDEFKGRRPAIRGSASIAVDPTQLRTPGSTPHLPHQSSGSRGRATPAPIDLASVRDRAATMRLVFDAWGATGWLHAFWGVPGGQALSRILQHPLVGAPIVRWFSQVDPAAPGLHPRYRWSERALRWASVLARVRLPRPQYVSLDDPLPIARWMAVVLRAGRTPCLFTYPSPAVRLCRAALDAGIDLHGARFILGGEPITAARLATIGRVGAGALPAYGTAESLVIGWGCLAAAAPDEVHLLHDRHALIQPGVEGQRSGLPAAALLISSLDPTGPFSLLNVSLGDRAMLVQRGCGCPLERLGWGTSLHTIRSYEKLTAGGMTFLDTDVVRALDEVLPERFGGGPTDYQLLEEEDVEGRPRLRLLVHPGVGRLDADAVADAFLTAIGSGSGVERVMALQWGQAGLLRVERRVPEPTASGKILHLRTAAGVASRPPKEGA